MKNHLNSWREKFVHALFRHTCTLIACLNSVIGKNDFTLTKTVTELFRFVSRLDSTTGPRALSSQVQNYSVNYGSVSSTAKLRHPVTEIRRNYPYDCAPKTTIKTNMAKLMKSTSRICSNSFRDFIAFSDLFFKFCSVISQFFVHFLCFWSYLGRYSPSLDGIVFRDIE